MNIVFVASKQASYPRVSMLVEFLGEKQKVIPIVSCLPGYGLRLASIGIQWVLFCLSGSVRKTQVVFVGFMAQLTVPLVRLVWKGPMVVDAFILLHDTLVEDRKWVRPKSWVARIARHLDRQMLRSADFILSDTQANAHWLIQNWSVPADKIRVFPAGAREDIFNPARFEKMAEPKTNYEILFWGSYIPLHGVPTILKAAKLLNSEKVQFTLVGRGQTFKECIRLAKSLNLHRVSFLKDMAPESLAQLANSKDLVLGIFGSSKKAMRVVPNKVYEAWSLGKPVITEDSPAIRELVAGEQHCVLVPAEDPEALANAIRWAMNHPEETEKIASNGHRLFKEKVSCTHLKKRLNEILNDARELGTQSKTSLVPKK